MAKKKSENDGKEGPPPGEQPAPPPAATQPSTPASTPTSTTEPSTLGDKTPPASVGQPSTPSIGGTGNLPPGTPSPLSVPTGGAGALAAAAQPAAALSQKPPTETKPVAVPFGAFMSVEFSRKYSIDINATTKVTATLRSVPPPAPFQALLTAWQSGSGKKP